jgi:hypothetical protein
VNPGLRVRLAGAIALVALLPTACAGAGGPGPGAGPDPSTTRPPTASSGGRAEVPEILRFAGPLLAGGTLRGGDLAGQDVALWFWAPW